MLRISIFHIDNGLLLHFLADTAHQFYCLISLAHGTINQASQLPLESWAMACGLNALIYKICVRYSTIKGKVKGQFCSLLPGTFL